MYRTKIGENLKLCNRAEINKILRKQCIPYILNNFGENYFKNNFNNCFKLYFNYIIKFFSS